VIATAKRALRRGEVLDGEGGFCVWGRQMPAQDSLERELLPLGLANGVKVMRHMAEGEMLRWSDVEYDADDFAVKVRREMEAAFGGQNVAVMTQALRIASLLGVPMNRPPSARDR
jgi:predicted homoserine dehydrogenase-like protein